MNLTRRRSITGLIGAALAAALTLTGCSSTESTPSSRKTAASDGASRLPAAEGKTSYPLTLESPFGKTVLQKRPERIAAVVPNAIDTELLLSLGVTPVLSSSFVKEGGYLGKHGADDVKTYEFVMGEEVPVEAIAASKPDLIVAVGWTDGLGGVKLADHYDRLKSIAPVVTSPDTSSQLLIPWQDSIRVLGETLDLVDAAKRVVDDHEEHFATLRKKHPEFEGLTATWAIFYGQANGLQYLSRPDSAPETFLGELGFANNPSAREFARDATVSDELLSKIDADVLLLGQSAAAGDKEMRELTGRDLFRNLGAVSSGNFVQLAPKTDDGGDLLWAISSGGPIGNKWATGHLVPRLADAL
ncbi:ABC transporter substrate-binding protein [Streptomyces sp. NPDC127068]|uniref:ABC transporter substrate-binding protein n=1 Tax=Streptomyces sp. NPDC127068 TaxID=3347127 RepID=UPI00365F5E7E